MERLQIIELNLEPNTNQTFDLVVGELERWLGPKGLSELPKSPGGNVTTRGSTLTPFGDQEIEIRARYLETPTSKGFLVIADQQIASELRFITDISLVQNTDGIFLRVGSSRNPTTRLVKPLPFTEVKSPTFLKSILRNVDVVAYANSTPVDGGFSRVQNDEGIRDIVAKIALVERLPILLIDTVRRERIEFAKTISQTLAGLVEVICVPWVMGIREFNRLDPEHGIPIAGARLIWPGTGAWNPRYEASDIGDFAISDISKKVRAASRVSRSNDVNWAKISREFSVLQRERTTDEIAARLKESIGKGELQLRNEIARLEQEVQNKDDEIARVQDELEEYVRTFDSSSEIESVASDNDQSLELGRLRSRIAWLETRVDSSSRSDSATPASLAEAPAEIGDAFFEYLERATEESILFTENARKSALKTGYLHTEKMRTALIQLSKASIEWRDLNGNLGTNPDDWFKTGYELTYANTDEPLRRSKLDIFIFEGQSYSRIPHIKLGDRSDRSNVGRIYFAWDDRNLRIIVDHVGQHLHGDGKG